MSLPLFVLISAAIVHVSGYILLLLRIEPFMYNFYVLAWWSYIFFADAILALRTGRFLVLNRDLPVMIVISSAFWCGFELINVRIHNWFYINIPSDILVRFFGYFLAYGTVIPGIYITKEIFSTLLGSIRVRPVSGAIFGKAAIAAGVLLFMLLMLFPDQCFFLAWVFLIPIIEAYQYIRGRWSFSRDLKRGEAGNLVASALSGVVCGLLWEMWNYWAVSKWVYSVPLFESIKLFEMPIPGYLGFIFFSFETILFLHLIRESFFVSRHRITVILVALAVSLLSFAAIDRYTVFSYTDSIDQLTFLSQEKREQLKRAGVKTSFAVNPRSLDKQEREALSLLHLKGLGPANLERLRQRGIRTIPELAGMTEDELSNVLGENNRQRLRVYLRAAREYHPPSSY